MSVSVAGIPKNRCLTTVAEPIGGKRERNCPLPGTKSVCLGRNQAARGRPATPLGMRSTPSTEVDPPQRKLAHRAREPHLVATATAARYRTPMAAPGQPIRVPAFAVVPSLASPYLPSSSAGEALPPPLDISPGPRAEWDFNPPDTSAVRHTLSVSLTAPSRSSSAMTSGLPVAAPRTASQAVTELSRFPCRRRMCMPGSQTTRGGTDPRAIASASVAFCCHDGIGTPDYIAFAAHNLAYTHPCQCFA
jgi:hypothetical protein